MSRPKAQWAALRPRGMKIQVWNEIVTAWENGLSDRDASFRASKDGGVYITEAEIKEILEEYPKVRSLKEFLQSNILSKAKLNIAEDVERGNISTSKWLLERKAPEEFSTKASVAFESGVVAVSIEDKKKELNQFMDQFDTPDEDPVDKVIGECDDKGSLQRT